VKHPLIQFINVLKNFADQIQQRLDVTNTCSRYSLDKILVVLHHADMEEAQKFSNLKDCQVS
jgi:PleD family two-component response regulator